MKVTAVLQALELQDFFVPFCTMAFANRSQFFRFRTRGGQD